MASINSITSNKDVDYISKDFDSTIDNIITFANVNFGPGASANRLWTNFNSSSFSRNWAEIVAYVADIFFFYFDVQATQSYLQTATIRSSVLDIAKQFGFIPASSASASGNVTFTFTSPGTLGRGFRVANTSGIQYFLTNDVVAGASGQFTGTVLQGQIKTETFVSKGLQNEEFVLQGPNIIVDDTAVNPLDLSPILTINGNTYSLVESFINNDGTDTPAITDSLGEIIGGGGRIFQLGEKPTSSPFIRFGDGIFGRKLQPNETIAITYRTGGGTVGNTPAGTISTLIDNASFVSEVTNTGDFSGGADEQTIEQLRDLIPASLRTLERAVSETDYSDLIVSKFSEVSKASTEINNDDPGIDLNIYVVPAGNTITAATDNSLLINRLTDFVDRRKTVTVQFQLLDAFGIEVLVTLEVFINNTASQTTVRNAIISTLTNFFNLNTGGISEAGIDFAEQVLLKDVTNLVQDIDGIDRFEIKRLSYIPRIQKNIQGLVTTYNASGVTIFDNVTESEWIAVAAGEKIETQGEVIFNNDGPTGFSYNTTTGLITYNSLVDLSGVSPGDSFRNGPGLQEQTTIQTVGDGLGATEVFSVTTIADQQGLQEVSEIVALGDIAGSLGGTYFIIYDTAGAVAVWFDVDSGNSQPSTGANRTIEIDISSNDSVNSVAGAIQAALNTDSEFSATVSGTAQQTQITTDSGGTLTTGQYFTINSANDAIQYYGWYNVDAGGGDPNVTGKIGIEIGVNSGDTADQIATTTASTLNANADFSAPAPGANIITVTNSNNGPATFAADVTVGGSFAVSTPVTGVAADTVTTTSANKADLFNTSDGVVPTGFTFNTLVEGSNPDLLGGTYFDTNDDVDAVRVWFDVDNSSSAPSAPGTGRLIEVDISANDSASDVASKLQSTLDGDAKFSAERDNTDPLVPAGTIVNINSNEVAVVHSTAGIKDDPVDGAIATSFTFNIITDGADPLPLDGKYFIISDENGKIAFWFDVDDSGTAEPAHGAPRSVEVNTITTGMTADQVAVEIEKAISSSAPYTTELVEISKITTTAGSPSIENKYFLLNAANNSTEYYVWYEVDGSGGTDPALAGKTGIKVNILSSDTADDVASTTQAAIDLIGNFSATVLTNEVTVTNVIGGTAVDIIDGTSPNGTGFDFEVLTQGATFGTSVITNTITVTSNEKTTIDDASSGTSQFTMTVTQQGIADNTDFTITSVDTNNSQIHILEGQAVNPVAGAAAGGSVRNGSTTYQSFKVHRRTLAVATNLSTDSITDNSLDLSIFTGTAASLSARVLIDNSQVFRPGEYATGDFFLVDGAGNVWEIISNTSNTFTTSITAINDAVITNVTGGSYKIVTKLVGNQILFNGSIFTVQFNSHNTLFSPGAQFTQIGTIKDNFSISKEQTNIGRLGTAADLISFNITTGEIRLNEAPDLTGIQSGDSLIDSTGQIFSITAVDNRALPVESYDAVNQSVELLLEDSGVGSQYSQGFQVTETDIYSVVSSYIRKEGNIVGNLTARLTLDDGTGLPDITNTVAISNSISISSLSTTISKVNFSFTSPPSLSSGTQYHLIISGDTAYSAAQQNNVLTFNNTGGVLYSYNSLSGVVNYDSNVDLSNVEPGNFFEDNDGTLFTILTVDNDNDTLTLNIGLTLITGTNGNTYANDNVYLAADNVSPSYANGEMSRFDDVVWSNSSTGPNQFTVEHDMIFTIEGPKSIKIDSNLTPVLGTGATISTRYYDDNNEISFINGLASGIITSASDVNALGKGTVGAVPNSEIDNFVFRTSRIADDIINLRLAEIPQISTENIIINIFGGVS